jgi:hypothetical protein
MAAAQAARETALHDREEALKQRARVARVRNIGVVRLARQMARMLTIIGNVQDRMDFKTKQEVFALVTAEARYGDAPAMQLLGWAYDVGFGVAQDYAKAREWFEKAADKGDERAMTNLGVIYQLGQGVAHDYAKAREWFEKAADKGDERAMTNLGVIYQLGQGVAHDYAKARELYEKAAGKGDAPAKTNLERLPIAEAAEAKRYAEALQLQQALAAKVEAEETKREGKPGEQTFRQLTLVAWYALFTKEFTKALTVANRSHSLFPDSVAIEPNRAHALMFMERGEEAKALYLAHKGKPLSKQDNRLWEHVIVEDFAEFRKAGLTHPIMADIEKELTVSR